MRDNDFRNLYKCITRLYHKGIISNSESYNLIKRLFYYSKYDNLISDIISGNPINYKDIIK